MRPLQARFSLSLVEEVTQLISVQYTFIWESWALGPQPDDWDHGFFYVTREEEHAPRKDDIIMLEGQRFKVVSVERELDDPSNVRVLCGVAHG